MLDPSLPPYGTERGPAGEISQQGEISQPGINFAKLFIFNVAEMVFLLIFNAYIFLRMNLLVCYVYFHYMTDRHTHIYFINVYLKPMFTDRWAVGLFIPCLGKLFSAELLRISKQITDSFQQKSSLPLSYLSFQLISTNPFKPFQIQITLKLPSFIHVMYLMFRFYSLRFRQ